MTANTRYHVRVISTRTNEIDAPPSDVVDIKTHNTGANATVDYDSDNDGLIEITTLAQLHAIRADLNGDGVVDATAKYDSDNDGNYTDADDYDFTALYPAAFPNAEDNMGCNESAVTIASNNTGNPVCSGYELSNDLDFDTGTADDRTDDTYYNGGAGWLPIAHDSTAHNASSHPFNAVFDGNNYVIKNLAISRAAGRTGNESARYRYKSFAGAVRRLGRQREDKELGAGGRIGLACLHKLEPKPAPESYAGGLAGYSAGEIFKTYVTGTVTSTGAGSDGNDKDPHAGGLIGRQVGGSITSSYARVTVSAIQAGFDANNESFAGGLVGYQDGGNIVATYARGSATASVNSIYFGKAHAGGLIGYHKGGEIKSSYSEADANAAATSGANTSPTLNAGGFVGTQDGGKITASYSVGTPSTTPGNATVTTSNIGGLTGNHSSGATTNSYWDTDVSGITTTGQGTGKTTSELQTPTAYGTGNTDIYKDWEFDLDNADKDNNDQTGKDDQWHFGTASDYPVLKYHLTIPPQRATITMSANRTAICESAAGTNTNACGTNPQTSAIITATLASAWHAPVTVTLPTNAAAYTLSPDTIRLPAGTTSATTTLTAVNNKTDDATDPSFTMTAATGDPWVSIPGTALSITITDEDKLAKPTGVKLSVDDSKIQVDWSAVTDATGYTVQWNSTSSTDWSSPSSATISSGSTVTHKITSGLDADKTYYFRVIATIAGYDDSAPSTVVSAKTHNTGANATVDYDVDNDGLIEISNLAQLNAIRWDLDGDGQPSSGNETSYSAAFPNAETNMGCSESVATITSNTTGNEPCKGYELTANLDLDTDGDGSADSGDTYWNSGQGWLPIGETAGSTTAADYTGEFDGHTFTISNLFINRSGSTTVAHAGLFAKIGSGAKIRNLKLKGVSVTAASHATASTTADIFAGGIAGESAGEITGSYVIGVVKAVQSDNASVAEKNAYAGGLFGKNTGSITSSYALVTSVDAEQKGNSGDLSAYAGGLVGYQATGSAAIAASYANGVVTALSESNSGAKSYAGGLIGYMDSGNVKASYSHAAPKAKTKTTAATATLTAGGLIGQIQTGASVAASYSTGAPTAEGGSAPTTQIGGLAGRNNGTTNITNSYWDTKTSGITATGAGTGKTTSQLQSPTAYGTGNDDIYKDWNIDLDSVTTGTQDGWDFGTISQYPALKYGVLTAADQRATLTVSASPTTICESSKGYGTTQGVTYACGSDNTTSTTLTATLGAAQDLPVTITLTTNAAYTLGATSITIAAGSTAGMPATVTLTAVNNKDNPNADPTFTIGGTTPANWVSITAPTLTIKDEDVLAKPTGLGISVDTTKLRADWDATTGADDYTLEWDDDSSFGSPTGADKTSGTDTNHSVTSGLTNGTTYHFRVIAKKDGYDDSEWSDTASATPNSSIVDYDADNDGLIDVNTLAKFNAIRWDLDGDGVGDKLDSNNDGDYDDAGEYNYTSNYTAVFTSAEDNMGCSESVAQIMSNTTGNPTCKGYELTGDIDFDTGTKGTRTDDTYHNSGQGWLPIGFATATATARAYTGEFDGKNGSTQYAISNLYINRSGSTTVAHAGLFAKIGAGGEIRNLQLKGVSVTAATHASASSAADIHAGAIAGENAGDITGSYAIGTVEATQSDNTNASVTEKNAYAGGLVGKNAGTITSSYARAAVTAEQLSATASLEAQAGGLVGYQDTGGTVAASFSTGTVVSESRSATGAKSHAGGLVGHMDAGAIKASYSHAHPQAKTTTTANTATLIAGGLVGDMDGGTITASFSTGAPTTSGGSSPTVNKGGLVGHEHAGTTVTNSYWDTDTSGIADDANTTSPEGKTTSALRTPTAYGTGTSIYKDWNIDVGGTSAADDPWDFGTTTQYPVLDYGLTATDQRAAITLVVSPTTICESAKGTHANACNNSSPPTTATLTATLDPAQQVPVIIEISETTAEYRLKSGSTYKTEIAIAAGQTSGRLTVEAVNDRKDDASDTTATLTPTTIDNWVTMPAAASLTIKDDDFGLTAPTFTVAGSTTSNVTKATLTWTRQTGATGNTLRYKEAADPTWKTVDSPTSPQDISSLSASGVYTFKLAATKTGYDDGPEATQTASPGNDYDADNDGLLEIKTLAQLNAVRWDLDGNGTADNATNETDYKAAFSAAKVRMGCKDNETNVANQVCDGYELSNNLDFNTNNSAKSSTNPTGADTGDTYWNSGEGWVPIGGTDGTHYTGKFDGNNNVIENLFIDRTLGNYAGLFAYLYLSPGGYFKDLGVTNVDVTLSVSSTTAHVFVGGLAGKVQTPTSGVYTTGEVNSGTNLAAAANELYIGGLTGQSDSYAITSSYSWADVNANISSSTHNDATVSAGGLIGSASGDVTASYAAGKVTANANVTTSNITGSANAGGLVGLLGNSADIHSSYARGDVNSSANNDVDSLQGGLVGRHKGETTNSFSTGKLIGAHHSDQCGLIAGGSSTTITASYYDSSTISKTGCNSSNGTATTTANLQTPTAYGTSIYKDWNADLDGDSTNDDPWDFGTNKQYPALKYGLTAAGQRPTITLSLSPTEIYERVGGATTSAVTATASAAWNRDLVVPVPQDTNAYTVSDITISAGETTGTQTLTAVNNYTDADDDYTKTMTLSGDHPAKIGGETTRADTWVIKSTTADPILTIKDDDELVRTTGVTATQVGGGVKVDWTKVTGATGYRICWKSGSEKYADTRCVTAGDVAAHTIPQAGEGNNRRFIPGTTYTLRVQATKNGVDNGQPSSDATAAFKGYIVISPQTVEVTEPLSGTATGTYSVSLGTLPSADVTITITRKADTNQTRPTFDTDTVSTGDQDTLTFTSANGTTPQDVTISVTPDKDNTDDESTTLIHTVTSTTDNNYTGVTGPEVVATAVDSSSPPTSENQSYDVTLNPLTYVNIDFRDFTYSDADSNAYTKIIIESLPAGGELWMNERRSGGPCKRQPLNTYCNRGSKLTSVQEFTTAYDGVWNVFKRLQFRPYSSFTSNTFNFKVEDSTGEQSESYTITLTKSGAPGKPTAFAVVPDDREAALSWTKPADPVGDAVTKHQVRWEAKDGSEYGAWTDVSIVSGTTAYTHTFTGLRNSATYYFRVRAVNNAGAGPSRIVETTVAPALAAPAGLTASPETDKVVLDWNDPSNTDITGYQYQRRSPNTQELREVRWQAPADTSSIAKWQYQLTPSGGSAGSWTDICTSADTTCKDRTSHRVQDSALVAGNYYSVKIRYQPSDTPAKIAAPTAGVTTDSSGNVTLEWVAVTGATGYQYRTQTGTTVLATDWSDWTDAGTGTSKSVTGLTPSANYQAQVRALKNNEEIVQADLLTAASQTLRSEAMRWPSAWTAMSSSGATTITHDVTTGLTDGATYEYRIRAHKGTGNAVKYSLPSSAARIALPAAAPSKPTGLEATPRAGSVALFWKNPNNTSIYKWQYSSDNGANWTDVPNSTATTASYTVPNLTDGAPYTFKVRAVNYKGESPASDGVAATPVGVPAKPANFSAVGQGNYCITNCDDDNKLNDINRASVQLTWDDLNDSTITGWQYQQKRGAGGYGGWKSMKAELVVSSAAPLTFTPNNWNNAQTVTVKLAAQPSETVKLALRRGGTVFTPSELTFTPNNWNTEQSVQVTLAAKPTASYTMRMFQTGVIYRPAYLVFSTNDASASKSVEVRLDAKPALNTTLTLTVSNAVFTPATLPFTADNWSEDQTASVSLSPDHRLNANVTFDLSDCCAYYAGSLTSYLVSDLKPSTSASDAYGYKIRAVNASGNGAESDESTTNTHERPGKPAGLTATAGANSAALTWAHPDNLSTNPVQTYQYQYKTAGAAYGAWTNTILTGKSAAISLTVSNLTGNVQHTFRVRGVNLYNDPGPASDEITVTPTGAPAAPTSLSVATGNKTLRVSWTAPAGHVNPITRYEYRTKPTSNTDWGGWASITGSNATTTTADLTVAANGVSHDAQIRAVNADGKGAASAKVTGTPSAVPAAPAGLTAAANNGQAALTWTNPNDSTITEYEYSKDGGTTWADVPSSSATTTSYTVTSLTDGTAYTLAIRAVNTTGNGLPTSVTATPVYLPLMPKGFTAVLASDTTATLRWTDPSDSTITKYQYTKDNGTTWADIPGSGSATITYTATGLSLGENYHFQVRAANNNGSGPPSDAVNLPTKPAKPTGFTATGRDGSVDMAWDDPENTTITSWQLRHRDFIVGTGSPQTITLEWDNPSDSRINQFRYRTNRGLLWYYGTPIPCSSPCDVATQNSYTFTVTHGKGARVTYDVAGVYADSQGVIIYYQLNPARMWAPVSTDTDAGVISHTSSSLNNNTLHNFFIRAVNSAGAGPQSDQRSAKPKAPPAAPTGLTASARNAGAVLYWTAATDDDVTGYEYQYKTTGDWGDTWTPMTGSANSTTSRLVTGLTNGAAHTFRIRAVSQYGPTAASNEATATPATAPAKPTILTATPMDGAVDLTWTDPSNNTITGWQYQYKTTGNYTAWQSMDSFLALRETAIDFGSHRDESAYRRVAAARQRLRRSEVPAAQAAAGRAGMERVDGHPLRIPMLRGDAGLLHLHRAGVQRPLHLRDSRRVLQPRHPNRVQRSRPDRTTPPTPSRSAPSTHPATATRPTNQPPPPPSPPPARPRSPAQPR